jgi:hypothetical protein
MACDTRHACVFVPRRCLCAARFGAVAVRIGLGR